mmetsp:Transcript_42719/g.103323  ORF Transcript_42719/g.103323 Transcript_42719/m.103323 type:complete len:285 (+) Transcript_42719:160-1014(+)
MKCYVAPKALLKLTLTWSLWILVSSLRRNGLNRRRMLLLLLSVRIRTRLRNKGNEEGHPTASKSKRNEILVLLVSHHPQYKKNETQCHPLLTKSCNNRPISSPRITFASFRRVDATTTRLVARNGIVILLLLKEKKTEISSTTSRIINDATATRLLATRRNDIVTLLLLKRTEIAFTTSRIIDIALRRIIDASATRRKDIVLVILLLLATKRTRSWDMIMIARQQIHCCKGIVIMRGERLLLLEPSKCSFNTFLALRWDPRGKWKSTSTVVVVEWWMTPKHFRK